MDPRRHREMPETFALQVVAVGAHLSPDTRVNGKRLASHLADKLRHFLVTPEPYPDGSTREPEAQGGIGGWTHNTAAQAILLARRTPAVWAELSADERHRADVLMRALAVAAHFCLDDDNDYYLLLDGESLFHKSWNPNHVEGYVGVIIAAALYFGADELNRFFETFDFDSFVAGLDALNFQNIRRCWTWTPAIRDLMMNGGSIAVPAAAPLAQGVVASGAGVRNAFTFQGFTLREPWQMHRDQALRLFAKVVRTEVIVHGENKSRLLHRASDATVSPWEGRTGMCLEFENMDWHGLRTSLVYAWEGVMIDLSTASALKALGEWKPDEGGDLVERRMAVGMSDLRFKAAEGYRGWANGGEHLSWWEKDLEPMGADFIFGLWEALFETETER